MKKPLSVYIHFPFCEKRCGYCDFVSCTATENVDAYLQKLCAEIRAFDFSPYQVNTIYLGGGTPSLMTPNQLEKVLKCLPACAGEVTIECNPNSLTQMKCAAYRRLGINRLSLGVQSFDNATLRDLERIHDLKQAYDAIKLAHAYFDNLSIDLIKDIPQHTFVTPPPEILAMIKHISIYSLTKDDHCVLDTDEPVHLPSDFVRYEVSNYARAGYESKHNLVYWTGGEYIGFGAGAHSLLNNQRFCNSNAILTYQRELPFTRSAEDIHDEQIMLGLRLRSGVARSLLVGKDDAIKLLAEHGLVTVTPTHVIATTAGLKVLNQIWLRLV
ncbi:MAG: coproporphyrinogen III oxidase family protein [Clostridia bacterium]|nr:coproporphyrinogen III oxidase family protein [Clostridia bacterium]